MEQAQQKLEDNNINAFDEYAAWTDSVAKYPPTAEPFYLALGIVDELGELVAAKGYSNVLKEAGDTLWYCARYCTRVLKLPFSLLVHEAGKQHRIDMVMSKDVLSAVGVLAGFEKKRIRDGAMWDDRTLRMKERDARIALAKTMAYVERKLAYEGYVMTDAIVMNQNKLAKRLAEGKIQGDGDNR